MDWSVVFVVSGAALILLLWVNASLQKIDVWPGYVAVLLGKSKPKLLNPGRNIFWGKRQHQMIFLGKESMWLPSQEIQTTDKIAARYSFSIEHQIVDPLLAVSATKSNFNGHNPFMLEQELLPLYRLVQAQIRLAIASKSVEEVREKSTEIENEILASISEEFKKWGREASSVVMMDIQLPAGIKNAQHQAETERILAAATLEKARSEVASLRALANAAKMIDENPNLAVLRKIQAIEKLSSGSVRLDLD